MPAEEQTRRSSRTSSYRGILVLSEGIVRETASAARVGGPSASGPQDGGVPNETGPCRRPRHHSMTSSVIMAAVAAALIGCATGEVAVFSPMDACPDFVLCDHLDKNFNISGVYMDKDRNRVYCHMDSGRWTEVMRRGQNAAGDLLDASTHQSFAPNPSPDPMVAGFGDAGDGEFYVGNERLGKIVTTMVQLKVALLGQDDERYFSVFDGFEVDDAPMVLGLGDMKYRMGTAGDGQLTKLDGATYDETCTPATWFRREGQTSCDGSTDEGPALTLPLTDTDQRGGRTPWPTLPVQLKAVSLQLHSPNMLEQCQGLEQHFAFGGNVLSTIENTLPSSVKQGDSFTISCKNSSWILPTKDNSVASIPHSVTFTCREDPDNPGQYSMDNHPIPDESGTPCMAPCPDGFSLYMPGPETKGLAAVPDRATCLSPPSTQPAWGLVDAAARCGETGTQLLDFVPKKEFISDLDTSKPLWIGLRYREIGVTWVVNSRDQDSGTASGDSKECVQVSYSGTAAELSSAECHSGWEDSNPYLNFVCMTAVGCADGAVFHAGFCYWYEPEAGPSDHVSKCQEKGATPADYTAAFREEGLPRLSGVPTGDGSRTPLVGIYRRYGKFWRPDGSEVPVSEFEGDSYGDEALKCAALVPGKPAKLKAINCETDTDHSGVICQTPGYTTRARELCSVRFDQLFDNSSTAGPPPTITHTGDVMTAKGGTVTFTCPDGYNVHNLTGSHSLTLDCDGFREGWQYPADLDEKLHGQLVKCVFACDVSESARPRNSELVTVDSTPVFRCVGAMQTEDGSTEQVANCAYATGQLGTAQPCDRCIGSPLTPGEDATFESSWDSAAHTEGTVVTFTCLSGLQTPGGDFVQNQTCTANGWEGEVVACSQCSPLEEDLQSAQFSISGPQPFGSLAVLSCPDGLQSGDGSLNTSASCLPAGWNMCLPDFNCSYCSGNPPNVSGMSTIESDWDGQLRELNTTVLYTCSSGLETGAGATEQSVNCTGAGWTQDAVMGCDVCSNPPNGSHPTIGSTIRTGEGTLGSSLKFVCNSGLRTEHDFTSITVVCTDIGWTNCTDSIKCEYCETLPNLLDGTRDWGSYADETALDTEVTVTCNPGLAFEAADGTFQKTQTVVCGLNGWNHTEVKSCNVCNEEPPAAVSSMTRDWTPGDSQVVYQCPNDTMLPWGERTYRMQCSPDGWSDCVPECTACVFPPAAGPGAVRTSSSDVTRGGTANYACRSGMTSSGPSELQLTCTETGWTEAEMITCDMCAGDPPESGPAQNRTGNVTRLIGNTLRYECVDNMTTALGLTEQSITCSGWGWTGPLAPCDHCPLPIAPDNATQTWDLPVNVTEDRVLVGTNITYTCSNITSILSTNSSTQTLFCGEDGWSALPEPCVSCLGDIPDPGNGTEARNVTWEGDRQEGAVVLYTCTNGARQEVRCVDREWLPEQLGPCVVPTTAPTGEVTIVTKATYDDKYPITTNYYWANIDVNMSSTHGDNTWTVGQGPAGFEHSLILQQEGCMSHQRWASRLDECAQSPAGCEHGFSFSLWAKIEMEPIDTLFNGSASSHKRYLLSTGGDDQGSPGVAIYVKGHALHALVSTGGEFWDVSVTGQLLSRQWTNIGVRWSRSEPFEVPESGSKLPGLQLYINKQPLARVAVPMTAKAAAKEGLDPGEVMVGCHRTAGTEYRDFCQGEFDELAMWTRLLPANESLYFLGGYDKVDQNTTMKTLLDVFLRCPECRRDAKMFLAFTDRLVKTMKTKTPTSAPVSSTAEATAAATADTAAQESAQVEAPEGTPVASAEEVGKVKALVDLVAAMTKEAKDPVLPEELELFLALHVVVGTALDKETLAQWRGIEYLYKEEGGTAMVVNNWEAWAMQLGSNTALQNKDNMILTEAADNIELVMQRTKTFQLRQQPIVTYPLGGKGLNTVTFASELFHNPDVPECRFVGVTTLFVSYPTLGFVSPQRYSNLDIKAPTSDLSLEGHVLSMKYQLDNPALAANCSPTEEQLRKYPIQAAISHTSPGKALRNVLFHDGEIKTGILRRACVWWNPDLSDYGEWDTDGCAAVEYSDFHTKCACAHFGQIAIMVQKVPPKIVDVEFMWLKIIKYICYAISALLLIVFIVAVIKIKALHEMFHLMRLNTAIGLLLGSILMVSTDIPEIREDRHTCTGFAAAIHFFYLLAATMVMLEGIADFISVTSGAIGGKFKSYMGFAWGVPFLSLGYAFLMHLPDYGTDPRCMLGWPDHVKMTMFLPLMVLLAFTFLMTCLVSCNMQASRLRKENIVAEQLTVCKGFVFFSFYFVCTWIVGLIAYMRLGLSIPSFYPLFQILNSTGGIIFFLFCGIGSERFRLLIAGKSELRQKMLFSYTVSEQLSESQQNLVEKEPSRPATPEDDDEEFDPEAFGPRGPIVA